MTSWQAIASRISHWTLYGPIFLMPITGWLMSSASAYSVSWFNLVPLPDLVSADPDLKETLEAIHKTLAKLMFVIAAVHITAALRHSLKRTGRSQGLHRLVRQSCSRCHKWMAITFWTAWRNWTGPHCGLGIGEWADTTWIGQFVTVVVHVETFE